MDLLELSWHRSWTNLGLQSPMGLFEDLVAAYGEPHRKYHTRQHLEECLAHFSTAKDSAIHPGEVEIALWFHDAIYDLKGKTNERRSADWALEVLKQAGASQDVQTRVENLIMATCHDAVPTEADQQLLVDIDLAILGAAPERFSEYDRQVKAEYSWVPGFLYRMKRKEVLKGFLMRQHIYCTPAFKTRYEQQARINLQAAIA